MRISIDGTPLLLRSAGVKNYLHYWIRALQRAPGRHSIAVFPFLTSISAAGGASAIGQAASLGAELDHESSAAGLWGTSARLAFVHSLRWLGSAPLDYALRRSDIFHASNLVRRAPCRRKLTATIHDLTCWLMPGLHPPANVQADREFAETILKHADGIIAVSESTRKDAIRVLNIPPEKITTIHSGVPESYFDAQPVQRARPYVLFVGTIEPRKNLDTLLDAWKRMPGEIRRQYDLVTAGPRGWAPEQTFARVRTESVYLGYVPEAQMPGLFAGATLFVYPSFYEGFGFPVAQALAARVPIVTSNTSSLPEVARDGAALVDPKSVDDLASAMARLLESPAERAKLAGYGRASAERFRWEKCAEQSIAFFERVVAN